MSYRIAKINQLIKQLLSAEVNKIFCEQFGIISINSVVVSPDLKSAKVYISCLQEAKTDQLLVAIQNKSYLLQQQLNKTLQIKFVPKLFYIKDQSQKNIDQIEELLTKINHESQL